MKKNVGGSDKIARYILGAGIIGAGVYFNSWWGVVVLFQFLLPLWDGVHSMFQLNYLQINLNDICQSLFMHLDKL